MPKHKSDREITEGLALVLEKAADYDAETQDEDSTQESQSAAFEDLISAVHCADYRSFVPGLPRCPCCGSLLLEPGTIRSAKKGGCHVKKEDYKAGMGFVIAQARLFTLLPLEEMFQELERADTLGPFTDPTLWREAAASGRLRNARDLLKAACGLKEVALRIAAEQAEKRAKEDAMGSDECDECDGSGTYYIDGEPVKCICSESQEAVIPMDEEEARDVDMAFAFTHEGRPRPMAAADRRIDPGEPRQGFRGVPR